MTGPLFRRLDMPGDSPLPPGPDESRLLPILAHLAADLLAARARGDDPTNRAPTFADLTAAGLTTADCLALISDGLLAAVHQPSRTGTVPVPSARKVAGSLREPSARRANKAASAGRSSSSSKNGQGRGAAKSPSPTGNRPPTGKSSPPAKKGRGEGHTASNGRPPHLGPSTRLLLTDAGLASITKHAQTARSTDPSPVGMGQGEGGLPSAGSLMPTLSRLLPHYDIELRELSVAGVVITELRLQARSLTAVLAAFQRARWTPRVVKPLNGYPEASDPQHLADAAYGLNHRQSLIEFRTDASAVRWRWRGAGEASR